MMKKNKTINYLKSLFWHKWYVLVACYRLGILWRGIKHDWSKFTPSELPHYIRKFGRGINVGRDKSGYYDPTKDGLFKEAWLHHTHFNDHHWQYWCLPSNNGTVDPIDMPLDSIYEMVADWYGASMAYNKRNGVKEFWDANKENMTLHPDTRGVIELIIDKLYHQLGDIRNDRAGSN